MLAEAAPHGGTGEESIAGFEYAGEIAAAGTDAGDRKAGDPVMGTTLGITQHREAADRLRSGNTVGKVVLTFA
ncbi:hypothetical protein ACFVUB_29440 [Streptomyces niveus]|uniref:hypothetical protein n=1 Tax=Streptomyces niveus TaxID=193462 RepID=UPI0036DAD343